MLPKSQAFSKVYAPKNEPQKYLAHMLSQEPNLNNQGYQTCSQKWVTLGAVNLTKWINLGYFEFDPYLRVKKCTNDYGFDKYHGQINESGQMHGVGRLCRVSG